MNELYIRVDMNSTIATGHMMRCLSIADAAADIGIRAVFISADESGSDLLAERGYDNIVLGTQWDDLESEITLIEKIINEKKITTLLIDSYYVTEKYLRELTKVTRTIYIDDVNSFIYPVNTVLCYANYFRKFDYERRYLCANMNTKFLLGCEYVPLRKEFQNLPPKRIKGKIGEVLVVSGGSDPYNVIGQIIDELSKLDVNRIVAICGRFNTRIESLKSKYIGMNVELYPAVNNLMEYMKSADLAISAGGSTLYELCACGTPTLSYSIADNQMDNVKQFEGDGLISYLGDARESGWLNKLPSLLDMYGKRPYRERVSLSMQKIIDAYGAKRIVNRIFGLQDR